MKMLPNVTPGNSMGKGILTAWGRLKTPFFYALLFFWAIL